MEKKKIFYGWWIVLACLLMTTTMVPPSSALNSVFTLPVTEELNITRSVFALRLTIISVIGILLAPFVGKIMKKYGMKKVHTIAIIGYALSLASNYFVNNVILFFVVSFVTGVFFIFSVLIPISMLINNWFIEKKGLAMSIAMAGIGIGGLVLSPILNEILKVFNWKLAYVFFAILVLVIAVPMIILVIKEKPSDIGLQPLGAKDLEKVQNGEVDLKNAPPVLHEPKVSIPFSEASKKPFFLLLLAGMLFVGLATTGSLGQMVPYAQQTHDYNIQSYMLMTYSAVGIFGKLILGWVDDKFGSKTSMIYGGFMFAITFVFYMLGHNLVFLFIGAFIYGLGNGLSSVSPPLVTASIFKNEDYPAAYGLASSAMGIGSATGGLITSAIYDATSNYNLIWISIIAMVVGAVLCWLFAMKGAKKYAKV